MPVAGPHSPAEFAARLYACEALTPPAARHAVDTATEPYSLEWYEQIESQRHKFGRWIPRLLEFAKHSGETLLGLGTGLGTDWLQYARNGASVIVCSPTTQQLGLVRRNFELRGIAGRFLHANPTCLPLETATIDVVCVSGLLDECKRPDVIVGEIYRVLKPGGKVLAVVPARFDVNFWFGVCFPWLRWFSHRKRAEPEVTCYSRRELRRLFHQFAEHRIHKRQLRRRDVPHVWRWFPRPILERLMGRFLILKAFKPLSSAMSVQVAA
jgi:ubiquinone/menaquinone biosynthesis C-methylase UbiE